MTDTLGNVQIPALNTDTPPGDPLLSTLLAFWSQCLTNALTPVWAITCPNIPVVKTTDARNPVDLTLTTTELPALFLDRLSYDPLTWEAADYPKLTSHLKLWWVLPRLDLKRRRQRSNIMQAAIAAVMFQTEWTGRAPGLIFPGDTDPIAATQGSLLLKFANVWSINWKKIDDSKLVLDLGNEGKQSFDCITWNIDVSEKISIDPSLHAVPLKGLLDSIADDGLPLIAIDAHLRCSSITPSSGTHLGGTAVTIRGTQIVSGATVTIGGVAATSVAWVDNETLTATTPAHAAGSADVVLTNPGGEAATLTSGFTFS